MTADCIYEHFQQLICADDIRILWKIRQRVSWIGSNIVLFKSYILF